MDLGNQKRTIMSGKNLITIMDTTLRDGEQTTGVAFNSVEKLSIAQVLLNDLKVDRIEVASARVSEGEFKGVQQITKWAKRHGHLNKIEVLGFVDHGVSIQWIKDAGAKVLNLLLKGSFKHVTEQLRKTPEEHLADAIANIEMAHQKGITVNVYLEDWSNGMRNSKDYVYFMINGLKDAKVSHIMLPDTLGILDPDETFDYIKEIVEAFPNQNLISMLTTITTWQLLTFSMRLKLVLVVYTPPLTAWENAQEMLPYQV